MHALETYLQYLRATRSSGGAVKETSYYPALANLLNEVGKTLKPKVRCIVHLQDTGGGIPDGGLFTEEQIRHDVSDLLAGATPARGAIEAKPASADAWKIAESKQLKEYWSRYRQVLVTNYRDCCPRMRRLAPEVLLVARQSPSGATQFPKQSMAEARPTTFRKLRRNT